MNTSRLQSSLLVVFAALIIIAGNFFIALPSCNIRPQMCYDLSYFLNAPYHYRILSFSLEHYPTPLVGTQAMLFSALKIHSIAVLASCIGLYSWLKRWLTTERAILGLFLLAVVWIFAMHFYQRDIAIALELAFVVWTLVLIESHLWLLVALTILATLNRETGFYIPLLYAAYHADMTIRVRTREWPIRVRTREWPIRVRTREWPIRVRTREWPITGQDQYKGRTSRYWLNTGLLLATYVSILLAIHAAMGSAQHTLGLAGTWAYNLENLGDAIIVNLTLLPLWILAALGFRASSPRIRRLMAVAGVMLAAIVVGASWAEAARLTLPMYPLILPAILWYPEVS